MKKIILILTGFVSLFTACSNSVDFGEQYEKLLYIVNSKELCYVSHQPIEASQGNISVYCTGSELPDEDIHIKYIVDADTLVHYNRNEYKDQENLYFMLVPDNLVQFESDEIVIRKGEEYGRLNFILNTKGLSPDRVYVLPITIKSSVEGYEISGEMHTIFYVISVSNEYGGNYISNYKLNGVSKGDLKKTARAIAARQVMLPLGANNEAKPLNSNTDFYVITINQDNSLVLTPYLQSVIHQNQDERCYYDPERQIFYVHYFIEDQYGDPVRYDEVLTRNW